MYCCRRNTPSVFVLADVSIRSPRKPLFLAIENSTYWIKISPKCEFVCENNIIGHTVQRNGNVSAGSFWRYIGFAILEILYSYQIKKSFVQSKCPNNVSFILDKLFTAYEGFRMQVQWVSAKLSNRSSISLQSVRWASNHQQWICFWNWIKYVTGYSGALD